MRPCPVFACYTLAFALQLRDKSTEKTSVKVVEKCQLGAIQCRHGRLLQVARTSRRSRFPCFTGPGSALGQRRHLPSWVTKGFPTSANFQSNLSVRDLTWSVIVDAGTYLQFLRPAILTSLSALVGNTLLNTSRAQIIIILVTVTRQIAPTGQEKCWVHFFVVTDPLLGNELFNNKQSINQIEI